jgi:hypothetical protein
MILFDNRYMHYSFPNVDRSDLEELVSKEFILTCLQSSPTRDLLQGFLDFDFKHWVSVTWCKFAEPLAHCSDPDNSSDPEEHDPWQEPWHEPLEVFEQVVQLSAWFREQVRLFITANVSIF